MRPRRTFARSPRAVPWETTLPWVTLILLPKTTARPGRADHDRAVACAKAVVACTSLCVGTSGTARIPNACARFAAGRPPSARPDDVSTQRPKPSMPPRNVRAVNVDPLHPIPRTLLKLRRRVVTQQIFFRRNRCATGPAAMNRLPRWVATRRVTAAPPVVGPFAGCSIVNASGGGAARSKAAGPGPASTRPPAPGRTDGNTIPPAGYPHDRRPGRPRSRTAPVGGRWTRPANRLTLGEVLRARTRRTRVSTRHEAFRVLQRESQA
jgi:hypothetical protein